jgi:ribosomal protein L7/L12
MNFNFGKWTISIVEREKTFKKLSTKKIIKELTKKIPKCGKSWMKIHLIKECRSLTGWGLKESKDFVEENFNPAILGVNYTQW